MPDDEREMLADRLHDASTELRQLPLGGRGHLADVCLEAAQALRATPVEAEIQKLDLKPGDLIAVQLQRDYLTAISSNELEQLREDLRRVMPPQTKAMILPAGALVLEGVVTRFESFTVAELQALVLACTAAGAYDAEPRAPWNHPVWHAVAREASATLDRAVRDEAWDERRGPAAS
jgi:hypothetical protein